MKNIRKALLLALLALVLAVSAFACGDDEHAHTFATTWSSDAASHWHAATCEHAEEKADSAAHTFADGVCTICRRGEHVDLTGISFADKSVAYTGKALNLTVGGTLASGVQVRYEYWDAADTYQVASDGVTEVGIYTVHAIFSDGTHEATLRAKLSVTGASKRPIDTSGITIKETVIKYDGAVHKFNKRDIKGTTSPERVVVKIEYWNADNTVKCADEDEGVSEAGTYTVRVIYTVKDNPLYEETYVTARMIIDRSYSIHYYGPTDYTVEKANETLYSPASVAKEPIVLNDAILADHQFEGWFLCDEGDTNVTTTRVKQIDATVAANGGDIYLCAKFHPYAPYPTPYTYTTNVTTAPTSLPAIPGYGDLQKDAVCILDMTTLMDADTLEENLGAMGGKYNNATEATGNLNAKGWYKPALPAEGGGAGFEWGRYHYETSGQYAVSLEFSKPNSMGYNLRAYNLMEFWVYSANATDQVFSIFIMTGGENAKSMTYDVHLDYSGWKKFSVLMPGSKNDFLSYGILDNITEIRFLGWPNRGWRSDNANLGTAEMKDVVNFIYLSNFYITSYDSAYTAETILSEKDLVQTITNRTGMTLEAEIGDEKVAALMGKMNLAADGKSITAAAENVFSDLAKPTTAIYERLWQMATAWSDPDSAYYRSEALLHAVVAGMNYMAELSHDLMAGTLPARDADMTDCCLYIADMMNLFGDYLSEKHAQSWGAIALHYFPSSLGVSTDAFLSSYINASVHLGMRNVREALTAIRQIAHVFTDREITLATATDADLTRFTALVASMSENMLPSGFVADLFDWFYEAVDAFTVDGQVPTQLASADLVPYLRAMLLLWDVADEETQSNFAAHLKLYMAKDATLRTRLTAARVYDAEATALAAVEAHEATACEPSTTFIGVFESTGCALYKTATAYLYISPSGVYSDGIDASAIASTADRLSFYGYAADGALAFVRGTQKVIVYNGTVTVAGEEVSYLIGGDNSVRVFISNKTTQGSTISGFWKLANAPVIAIAKGEGGAHKLTLYTYTGIDVNIRVDGQYAEASSDDYDITPNEYGTTDIVIRTPQTPDRVFTMTLTAQ